MLNTKKILPSIFRFLIDLLGITIILQALMLLSYPDIDVSIGTSIKGIAPTAFLLELIIYLGASDKIESMQFSKMIASLTVLVTITREFIPINNLSFHSDLKDLVTAIITSSVFLIITVIYLIYFLYLRKKTNLLKKKQRREKYAS